MTASELANELMNALQPREREKSHARAGTGEAKESAIGPPVGAIDGTRRSHARAGTGEAKESAIGPPVGAIGGTRKGIYRRIGAIDGTRKRRCNVSSIGPEDGLLWATSGPCVGMSDLHVVLPSSAEPWQAIYSRHNLCVPTIASTSSSWWRSCTFIIIDTSTDE